MFHSLSLFSSSQLCSLLLLWGGLRYSQYDDALFQHDFREYATKRSVQVLHDDDDQEEEVDGWLRINMMMLMMEAKEEGLEEEEGRTCPDIRE